MPRGLSTQIAARIAAGTVRPVYLASFDFLGGTLRTWTGNGDLSYESQTWSDDLIVTQWPTITESVDLVANEASLELSGQYNYGFDLTDPAQYRARTCEVFIGLLEADGSLPATNIYKLFSGRMAVVGVVQDGEADAYSISVESRLVDLTKAKAARYSHQTQLQRFSGDMGLEYAGAAQGALFLSRGEQPEEPFPRKVVYGNTVVDGAVVFIATSGSGSRYLNLVVAFADHECDAIEQLYLDGRSLLSGGSVAGEFVNVVDYYPHLGAAAQTYDTYLSAEVGSTVWSSAHRLRGICYVYLRVLYSEDLFGDSAPAVSARIRGKKLYDPRTSTTAYSDNAALAVRDFLLSENYGFSSGAADVDDAAISVAANNCDYLVTTADASNEKRYLINGWLDTSQAIGQNLQQLLNAMAGKLSYMGGVFALYSGSYALSSLVLNDSDIVTDINFINRNLRNAYNGARGLYRTPDLNWQEEDYPAYQNAAAFTADSEARWLDLSLPLTTSAARCQRLAKIAVMRSRAARSIQASAKLSMLDARAGDVISVNTAKTQIGAAAYEIESVSVTLDLVPSLDFNLIEVAAADYAWDASTEEAELTVPAEPASSILEWTLARLGLPSATPGSKSFTIAFNVTIAHNESGVTCRYTTDGSEPSESDPTVANGGTIAIPTSSTTLKLKNFQNSGSLTSNVATYDYTYNPPTNLVPTPVHRWVWDLRLRHEDLSVRCSYAVVGLDNTTLRNSENGGNSWATLASSANNGTYYVDTTGLTSSWSPSNFRAYATKPGYLDSNQFVVPDRCIPPALWAQDYNSSTDRLGIMNFSTNGTIYWRSAMKSKSGGNWSQWSSWQSRSGMGWRDYIGTQTVNLNLETSSNDYQYEVYCAASGFQDSIVIFIDSDARRMRYGGESGSYIGGFYSVKSSFYS